MIEFEPSDFPLTPGVYLMKSAKGRIIYVGKAKSLRKRLASYFRSQERHTAKTRALVGRIASIDTLSTATEKEALLLEESLIKKHRPRYNVVLRDDKRYVLFRLDKGSDYPRLTMTRRVVRDGSVYYGPFTSALAARQTWKVINRVFPLRKCKDAVFRNRTRPCLYHYIGQCLAPCVLEVDRTLYDAYVRQVEYLLSGRSAELIRSLERDMNAFAEDLAFEKAAELRDQIQAVRRTVEQQAAVLPESRDLDVLGLAEVHSGLALSALFVRQGRLLDKKSFFWPGLTVEDGPEAVDSFLGQFYGPSSYIPDRILLPCEIEDAGAMEEVLADRRGGPVRLAPPSSGPGRAEKKLMELAAINARELVRPSADKGAVGTLLAERLGLAAEPVRIECVDASHLGGQSMRVGMVVFEDGEPRTDDYRLYAFPELEGTADDYRALAGWVARRVDSGPPWPDLVLVDGGKGQLAAVERAFGAACAESCEDACAPTCLGGTRAPGQDAGAAFRVELASIAKATDEGRTSRKGGELDDRVFRPGRKNPLNLKPGSPELLFLQRVRDTAHDFVLGRQRQTRSKQALKSELLQLESIGPKTARLLWDRFDSIAAMAEASLDEIKAVPGLGPKRAASIHAALQRLKPQ